jgi:hypothetical protein
MTTRTRILRLSGSIWAHLMNTLKSMLRNEMNEAADFQKTGYAGWVIRMTILAVTNLEVAKVLLTT